MRPISARGTPALESRSRAIKLTTSRQPTATKPSSNSVLYLQPTFAKFNGPSKSESVFFDECNREIINSVAEPGRGRTKVVFQKTQLKDRVEFYLPIEKRILSIKLNSSWTVLAYHVERNIIEFYNILESKDSDSGQVEWQLDSKRYIQTSRAKNSKLIGFLWVGPLEIVIITDLSIEYFHVDPIRRRLNHIKLFQSATNWFVYQPSAGERTGSEPDATNDSSEQHSILMVSTGSLGNSMQPYMFHSGHIIRLQRFEVEGNWNDCDKLELFERSITIAQIYSQVRLLVLQHESLNVKSKGAQIVLYTVDTNSGVTCKTHTLDLDVGGKFAINVLDNLVVAHDQPSKTSFVFDIMIDSTEKSDCPSHFVSLIDSQPIRPMGLTAQQVIDTPKIEMYSLNWVFFQPNFIVDAKLGLLSTLQIDLEAMQEVMQDNLLLLSFLANRQNSDKMILKKCKQIVESSYKSVRTAGNETPQNSLADVSYALEVIGKLIVSAPELPMPASSTKGETSGLLTREAGSNYVGSTIYQEDIQREVFRWLETEPDRLEPAQFQFVVSILLELIFVIRRLEKAVEFCVYEQLLKFLVSGEQYFQIVQMIRGDIVRDSKQLACLLISFKDRYKPAGQLGLDMFHRLPCGVPQTSFLAELTP